MDDSGAGIDTCGTGWGWGSGVVGTQWVGGGRADSTISEGGW